MENLACLNCLMHGRPFVTSHVVHGSQPEHGEAGLSWLWDVTCTACQLRRTERLQVPALAE